MQNFWPTCFVSSQSPYQMLAAYCQRPGQDSNGNTDDTSCLVRDRSDGIPMSGKDHAGQDGDGDEQGDDTGNSSSNTLAEVEREQAEEHGYLAEDRLDGGGVNMGGCPISQVSSYNAW